MIVSSSARLSCVPCTSQSTSVELAGGGSGEARKEPGSGEATISERCHEPPALTGLSHGTAVYATHTYGGLTEGKRATAYLRRL